MNARPRFPPAIRSDALHKLTTDLARLFYIIGIHWTYPACGVVRNRDVYAAVNLKNMAVSSTVAACGEEGSGLCRKTKTKSASMKQEVGFVPV